MILSQLIDARARRHPHRPALVAPGRPPTSYDELRRSVEGIAHSLAAAGATATTPVATALPNGPVAAIAFLGVASFAPCAPLDPASPAEEMRLHLEDCGARFVLLDETVASGTRERLRGLGLTLIDLRDATSGSGDQGPKAAGGAAASRAAEPSPGDVALLLRTSGTTARPKLVPLTHANLLASARSVARGLALAPADRCLNVMPLFHIHGLIACLLAPIYSGSSVVCTPGFRADAFIDWVGEFQPTWYSAVPTIHRAVASIAEVYRRRLPQHRFRFIRSSSAALPPATMRELESATGAPVIEAYGMTEASHQMAANPLPPGVRKPGSVGLPAGAEIAIMDAEGNALPGGSVGEIVVRGPGVMSAYGGQAPANGAAFFGSWFRTGDLGHLDRDGYLFIRGRAKEIVNRGGNKVSPREVDDALLEHAEVAQAAAFGVPHATLGEDLVAAVVRRPGSSVAEPALRDFLFARLSEHKVPSRIVLVDDLPKGTTGKVQRHTLPQRLGHVLAASFAAPTTDTESSLATILQLVLQAGRIGVHDNFFALGGDSLKGLQAVNRINQAHGLDLPVTALFHHPTIAQLAAVVTQAEADARARRAALEREIASMSDAEVERLLAEESESPGRP